MGDKYILTRAINPWKFLNKEVYGTHQNWFASWSPNHVVNQVSYRYRDWEEAKDGHGKKMLPSPYNHGQGWYVEVFAAIKADLYRRGDLEEWRKFWKMKGAFENSGPYDKVIEEYKWNAFSEGLVWLGI